LLLAFFTERFAVLAIELKLRSDSRLRCNDLRNIAEL
jgi:hypothetical protein